jgi:hypothetical protein
LNWKDYVVKMMWEGIMNGEQADGGEGLVMAYSAQYPEIRRKGLESYKKLCETILRSVTGQLA